MAGDVTATREQEYAQAAAEEADALVAPLREAIFAALGGGPMQEPDRPVDDATRTKMEAAHAEGQAAIASSAAQISEAINTYVTAKIEESKNEET